MGAKLKSFHQTTPKMNTNEIINQIQELDKQYVLAWSKMQDYAKGTKKHRLAVEQFVKISSELVKLKQSIA